MQPSADNYTLAAQYEVRRTDDWICEIDEYRRGDDQRLVCHIRFFNFTPASYRQFLAEWKLFRSVVTAPLFASPEVDDAKWERFVRRLGFVPFRTVPCNDGLERRLFINTVS